MSSENNANRLRNENNHLAEVDKQSVKRSKPSSFESDSSIYPSCSGPNNLQLNNLFLVMTSSTRDSLISILVQFSSVIAGQLPTAEGKEKLLADNCSLIESLGNLELRLEDEENDEHPRKKARREQAAVNRELVFIIDWNLKSKIISLLLANKNFAFVGKTNSVTIRTKIVNQNSSMIGTLIKLQPDPLEVPAVTRNAGRAGNEEDSESQTETSNVTNQVVKKLNDRITDLENRLKNDLKCLREELVQTVQDVNIGRSTIEFDWKLEPFSKLSTTKVYRSSWFYVRNVPWYLFARVSQVDGKDSSRFLDLFVCIQNNMGCNKWTCSTEFEIRILNQSGNANIVVKNEHTFKQNEGFGSEKVVSLDKLAEHGFVKDDALSLQVKLKAGEIIKN